MNIDTSLLHRAAAELAGRQHHAPGTLYVVATPIGNLADLSLRAVHVLGLVDLVACEDTRVSGALLAQLGLRKPLLALHAHNEREAGAAVLAHLAGGASVALVSDAGTPTVSDPGAALVAAATASGHPVVPVPGPSSAMAALSVAGDAGSRGFRFVGFVPSRGAEREHRLVAWLADPSTLVMFEAPHRIEALAARLAALAPQRRVTLARELTKQFEDIATMPASELPHWLAADAHRGRGEFVLVAHALATPTPGPAEHAAGRHALGVLLRALPLKQAVMLAAEISGAPRKVLYALALAEREGARDTGSDPGTDTGSAAAES